MNTSLDEREPRLEDVVSLFKDFSDDETGGQHAVRGFSFQVWQAVLEAFRAHATGEDYAVVLEWQQDIAVLDSSRAPRRVSFTQLKKNESSSHWTLANLLSAPAKKRAEDLSVDGALAPKEEGVSPKKKKKKKASPEKSILAKLYFHRRRFTDLPEAAELIFSSNVPFSVAVGDEEQDEKVAEVKLEELPPLALAKVTATLRKQLEIPEEETLDLTRFSLRVTNCPIEESHKFAIGELVELCAFDRMGVQVAAPFVAVCLVASYVQQRAGKGTFAKDFQSLLARAVTRDDITKYFAAANDSHVRPQALVEQIISRLNSEGADYDMVDEMEQSLNSVCAEITNRTGPIWPSVHALVELYAQKQKYSSCGPKMESRFSAWLADFHALKVQEAQIFGQGFLYCLMAMIVKNAQPIRHLSALAAGSQLEAKT